MGFVDSKTNIEYHQTYPFKYIFLSEAENASCVCCVSRGGQSVLIPDLLLTNKKLTTGCRMTLLFSHPHPLSPEANRHRP